MRRSSFIGQLESRILKKPIGTNPYCSGSSTRRTFSWAEKKDGGAGGRASFLDIYFRVLLWICLLGKYRGCRNFVSALGYCYACHVGCMEL